MTDPVRVVADLFARMQQRDNVGFDAFATLTRDLASTASNKTSWHTAALWQGPAFHLLLQDRALSEDQSETMLSAYSNQAIGAYHNWMQDELSHEGLQSGVDLRV